MTVKLKFRACSSLSSLVPNPTNQLSKKPINPPLLYSSRFSHNKTHYSIKLSFHTHTLESRTVIAMKVIRNCCMMNSRGMRSVHGGYDRLESVSGDKSRSIWKWVWRKVLREKRKMFDHNYLHSWKYTRNFHVPYDECSYAKNFDQGLGWYNRYNIDDEGDAAGSGPISSVQIIHE